MRTRIWHSDWKPRWLIRCVSAALLSFMDKQEMDRRKPAPQVGGPWRGCGIRQACIDGEKKDLLIRELRAEFVGHPLVARNIVLLNGVVA